MVGLPWIQLWANWLWANCQQINWSAISQSSTFSIDIACHTYVDTHHFKSRYLRLGANNWEKGAYYLSLLRQRVIAFHLSWSSTSQIPVVFPRSGTLGCVWYGEPPCAPRFHIHSFKKYDIRPAHSLFPGPTCAHFSVISLPLDFHCLSLVLFSFLNWNQNFTHSSIFHSVFLSDNTVMIYFYAFKIFFSQFISGFCVCLFFGGRLVSISYLD